MSGFNLVLQQRLVTGFGVSAVGRGSPAVAWHTLAHAGTHLSWTHGGVVVVV